MLKHTHTQVRSMCQGSPVHLEKLLKPSWTRTRKDVLKMQFEREKRETLSKERCIRATALPAAVDRRTAGSAALTARSSSNRTPPQPGGHLWSPPGSRLPVTSSGSTLWHCSTPGFPARGRSFKRWCGCGNVLRRSTFLHMLICMTA